jgi:sulfate permease, SulP family
LVFEVLVGLILAIVIALGLVIWKISTLSGSVLGRTSDGRFKDIGLSPGAKQIEGIKIFRLDIGMFYANAPVIKKRLQELMRAEPQPKALIVDMEIHTRILDVSSGRALEKVLNEAKQKDIRIVFVGVHTLTMRDMEKQGLVEQIGRDNFKETVEQALKDLEVSP